MSTHSITPAQTAWRENDTLISTEFQDVYYSTNGALDEIDYVFMQHNQLPQRFKSAHNFCVAETGFGTGQNFLRCSQQFLQHTQSGQLHFISFEKHPLSAELIQQVHHTLYAQQPCFLNLSQVLIAQYPVQLPGWHTLTLIPHRLKLTLWFGDALAGLNEFDTPVDAWFLDGFTPKRNPDLWQPRLFTQMARLSHLTTTFATFSANSDVRRGLLAAGFKVQKDAGFGIKREMLYGQLQQQRPYTHKFPWFAKPQHTPTNNQVIVVGAGLAGATTAYRLAKLGYCVTVLEQAAEFAQGASSNLAGTICPVITSDWNLRSQWYFKGYQTTQAWLKKGLLSGDISGNLNGIMQLATTPIQAQRLQEAVKKVGFNADFAQWKTQAELSQQLKQTVNFGGLFFPQGGWIHPASVIKICLKHPNIQLKTQSHVQDFMQHTNHWLITLQNGQQLSAPTVVIATGALSNTLNQKLNLPVRPVKGQVTHLSQHQVTQALRYPITHGGYSVSINSNTHVSGASFEAPDLTTQPSQSAHLNNLKMAQDALPNWLDTTPKTLSGNLAFRPTSPDHLPMIGPVADPKFMHTHYLSQNPTQAGYCYKPQQYLPGLYVNNGHGARGLMSVFLAADLLGDLIHQMPLNLPNSLYYATHPARFKIREWRTSHPPALQ